MTIDSIDGFVALGALLAFAARNLEAARAGRRCNAFWLCNVTVGLVPAAILLRQPALSDACFICLLLGTPVWFTNFALTGRPSGVVPRITGFVLHVGGLLAATYAVCRNGYAPEAWQVALALQIAVFLVSRIALPAEANVNAARAVPAGWEFAGGPRTFRALYVAVSVGFVFVGQVLTYYLARLASH